MTILVLWREEDLVRESAAYARAFRRRGVRVVGVETSFPLNGDINQLLQRCPERPTLILHPEFLPMLPWGLTAVDIPTACFQIDTFAYTRRRISWSMVFDLVFVFHPGYDAEFQKAGHPQVHLIPHAIDASIFSDEDFERVFEVGWVGQTEGPLYQTRARLLPELSRTFRMNEWSRRYSQEETARAYLQSQVVVNIGRDDFPQDANLRVFEAMAAGALLITKLPSELTQLGFEEGVHFIGYHEAREIVPLVRKYLGEESTRRRIVDVAREKVLCEYTYDHRVDTILETTEKCGRKLAAPARAWSEEKVRLAYLDYFAGNGALDYALAELLAIARRSLGNAARGTALLARAWARKLRQ
ncbi:MAG TPA: glycosyltransferase [Candidatus Dormibacteraeota bacterium]|nr:glycosyltransferase [Candidatus Dormibacteraeota bacterium]